VNESGDQRVDPAPGRHEMAVREARLRPEFADRYPGMQPGMWYLAATVASAVRHDETAPRGELRPLPDPHFEFRGGVPSRPRDARTRSSDRPGDFPT
jgi:hypothetical protein